MFKKILFGIILSFVSVLQTNATFQEYDTINVLKNPYALYKLIDNADSDTTSRGLQVKSTSCQGYNGGNVFRKETGNQYWGSATQTLSSISLWVQSNNTECDWRLRVYDVNIPGSFLTDSLVASSDNLVSGATMNLNQEQIWTFDDQSIKLSQITAAGLWPENCVAGTNNVNYRGTLMGVASSTRDEIPAYNFCKVPTNGSYNVYTGDPFIYVNTLLTTSSTVNLTTVSTTCDFNFWQTSVELPRSYGTSTAASSTVVVAYAGAPSYDHIIDLDYFYGLHIGQFNVDVFKRQSLFDTGVYFAKAFICPFDQVESCDMRYWVNRQFIEAESDWQQFTVSNSNCAVTPAPYMTSTTLNLDTLETPFCGTNSNILTRGLCNVMTMLFFPSGSVLNKYEQLKDNISQKPPFGYFTAYSILWQQIGVSSTVATTTPTQNWSAFSPVTTMRTALGYLLWGLFGTYLIIRFKNIDF